MCAIQNSIDPSWRWDRSYRAFGGLSESRLELITDLRRFLLCVLQQTTLLHNDDDYDEGDLKLKTG